ncbi:hypothetical protein Tco_0008467 [Tanacetum coccineum]
METEEISDRYVAPCFVIGLEAYDGEINLRTEENMILNEFAMKLCLDHKVRNGSKLVKKELIVALRGEIYFVKFIINPEEDDVEPGVVLGRPFMRLTKGITDFRRGIITIYPELDTFLDSSRETEKTDDDWDLLLDDIDFGDVPKIEREEAEREALAINICRRYSLLEEERPVIETMAYSDKYKKILDEICIDKIKLDGEMKKEEEEVMIRIKGEALIEKEDPEAFVILIRLEAKINLNALVHIGSDINLMPYRVYKELGREEVTGVKRGITMLNHSKAEPMRLLKDVMCQRYIDTLGRRFLYTCGSILNTIERITSTFDRICHQTFHATKTSLDTAESDSDAEERYSLGLILYRAPCAIKGVPRIRVLKRDLELRDNKIENLRNELEEVKKEKESIDFKIENFDNASKDLDSLLGNKRLDKDKKGLGFNEYSAVPPPPAQVYSPPKKDLRQYGKVIVPLSLNKEDQLETNCEVLKANDKVTKAEGKSRNWNNQKSKQLGSDFVMIKKAALWMHRLRGGQCRMIQEFDAGEEILTVGAEVLMILLLKLTCTSKECSKDKR